MPDELIAISGVSVRFGSKVALDDVTLSVGRGEFIALMGPSGAGKSTMLTLMAGLEEPTVGTVERRTARVAWVFQTSPMLSRRSALDNVLLGPKFTGVPSERWADTASAALGTVGIADLADKPVYRLSGGERQRVAIARAIAADADLLLADEPTASLDAENRSVVCDALVHLRSVGVAVVMATHDAVAAGYADRLVHLDNGRIDATP